MPTYLAWLQLEQATGNPGEQPIAAFHRVWLEAKRTSTEYNKDYGCENIPNTAMEHEVNFGDEPEAILCCGIFQSDTEHSEADHRSSCSD